MTRDDGLAGSPSLAPGPRRIAAAEGPPRRRRWSAAARASSTSGSPTRSSSTPAGTTARLEAPAADLATLGALFGRDLAAVPLAELVPWLESLTVEPEVALRVPAVRHAEERLEALGAGAFVAHIREIDLDPADWSRQLDYAWLRSSLDAALAAEPELAAFDGTNQQRLVDEFVQLDRAHLDRNVARVRRAYSERAIEVMNQFPDQAALIRREAQKRARHLPIRRLLAEAPDVLTALTPCARSSWMRSSSLMPTSDVARPPNACENAIRSGIFVIGSFALIAMPIVDPMRRPATMKS